MPKSKRRRAERVPPAQNLLQLKVTLKYIRPPVWRRLLVPDNLSLGGLHHVIQAAMGWTNSHLHAFQIGLLEYGAAGVDEEVGSGAADEDSMLLRHVLKQPGIKFRYDYDFGDSWEHEVKVEKFRPADNPHPRPTCLAGQRACPPEDCGGVPGYYEVLRVLKKARGPADREFRDWVGDYDPEQFDLAGLNEWFGH